MQRIQIPTYTGSYHSGMRTNVELAASTLTSTIAYVNYVFLGKEPPRA